MSVVSWAGAAGLISSEVRLRGGATGAGGAAMTGSTTVGLLAVRAAGAAFTAGAAELTAGVLVSVSDVGVGPSSPAA